MLTDDSKPQHQEERHRHKFVVAWDVPDAFANRFQVIPDPHEQKEYPTCFGSDEKTSSAC